VDITLLSHQHQRTTKSCQAHHYLLSIAPTNSKASDSLNCFSILRRISFSTATDHQAFAFSGVSIAAQFHVADTPRRLPSGRHYKTGRSTQK
jgi:hypothetical protein